MQIAKHAVVSLNYTLKNSEGELLDTSEGREPLVYLHGVGGLIPGLEQELEEKAKGDKVVAIIAPEDAYGTRRDDLLKIVSKDGFQGEEEMKPGMQVQLDTEHGPAVAVITKMEGDDVTLDLNHPLADMTLHFDVQIEDVREGTEDEISHGHVHGAGGHQH
ncbi:MAG: FKBP-type peptidyl-prolyl cis-trans isomerase SlyD [Arenicella sp.]|jgi:FKBP-type peptidyl-prolyl cis-trans isomerase SlyD